MFLILVCSLFRTYNQSHLYQQQSFLSSVTLEGRNELKQILLGAKIYAINTLAEKDHSDDKEHDQITLRAINTEERMLSRVLIWGNYGLTIKQY